MDITALVVSIVSAIIAIVSFTQAIILRIRTKKETEEHLSLLTQLVINSAPDPDTVRRMVEDYNKTGEWQVRVSRRPDGKYILNFDVSASDGITGSDKAVT